MNRAVTTIQPPVCVADIPTAEEAYHQVEYGHFLKKQKLEGGCGVDVTLNEIVDAEVETHKVNYCSTNICILIKI
jgi:hypothetical protein